MRAKGYSYVRFSTADQIKGDSRRRQIELADKWCKANKVELVQRYEDLGVSAFKGRNAENGALAEFLVLVRKRRIPKGSFLIVESLDRVSRNSITEALELFLGIIRSGVVVVTLMDGQRYDVASINNNMGSLMMSLATMYRAHEESRMKSQRISASWDAKRRRAGTEKLTAKCVAWVRLSQDRKRFELIPERAAVIRRIYQMTKKGHGAITIAKTLTREGVPTFGRSKAWHMSYIKKILNNRAVIGEFCPAMFRSGKRVFFDPIPGYYPAALTRELYATVQQVRKTRPSYAGRSNFNAFTKMAFDRTTGSAMVYSNKNRNEGWHYLVASHATVGLAKYAAWQYDDFLAKFLIMCETAALRRAPEEVAGNGKVDVARMELDDLEKQIARLVDVLSRGSVSGVEAKLRELETKRATIQEQIRKLDDEAIAAPRSVADVNWRDPKALRLNLRATVRKITMDAATKWFRAEFLDGRAGEYQQDGETFSITWPERLFPRRKGNG